MDPADLDLSRGRLRDLDDIPSPYLTGLLDDFLADPDYCPIIETNRGCPYSCTFCNWGAMGKSKSASFSMDRVIAELEYISEKNVSRSPFLYIGDANFGLFARDVEIAEMLRRLKDEKGFPQNVYLYYAKNSSEKVVRIAGILKGMSRISLSRQTQNDQVLENIKRSNISIDTFNQLSSLARELGVDSFVELIYTLPGESKDSFLTGVRNIMENDVDALHFFPAMLLHGSEMGTRKSRAMFGLKGEWRAIDGCAGEYGPVRAMEYEEIITSSAVMTREEHFEIRMFHFLQTIILDTKFYKEIVWLTGNVSIIDVILSIMANYKSAEKPFRELIDDFIAQAKAEFLKQPPSSWSSEEIAQRINASVKLNPLFTVKLLYDPGCREAFHRFMIDQLASLCGTPVELSTAVFEYLSVRLYPFDGEREHAYQLHLDLEPLLANRQGNNAPITEYLLHTPKTFLFRKDTTYQEYLNDWPTDTPLPDRLYDIVLHHSHEKPHQTLVSRFAGEASGEHDQNNASSGPIQSRVAQLEGGWLY